MQAHQILHIVGESLCFKGEGRACMRHSEDHFSVWTYDHLNKEVSERFQRDREYDMGRTDPGKGCC